MWTRDAGMPKLVAAPWYVSAKAPAYFPDFSLITTIFIHV